MKKRMLLIACVSVCLLIINVGCESKKESALPAPVTTTTQNEKEVKEDFTEPSNLHLIFEKDASISNPKVETKEENGIKIIKYNYEASKEASEKDIFENFIKKLEDNKYTIQYQVSDAVGFRSGFLLDNGFEKIMVETVSNEDHVTLIVSDYANAEMDMPSETVKPEETNTPSNNNTPSSSNTETEENTKEND